jgi:damage-control phosphatase, subfamily II, stand-alone protein
MSHFCLLRDATSYIAHDWDLLQDDAARAHWLGVFRSHFVEMMKHALAQYGRKAGKQIAAAQRQFDQAIAELGENPRSLPSGRLNIIELCRLRENALRANGLHDPFKHIKDRENRAAIPLYEPLVRKAHAMPPTAKWLHLMQCVFAGNIFDLGATQTMHLAKEATDFAATLQNVKPRPWLIDDFDRLAANLAAAPPTKWSKAVIFLDNAGVDFVLGVMPLARELGLAGAKIVLAANEVPSLNDITADEAAGVVEQLAATDDDLASMIAAGMIEVVSTGNDIPLIDLSEVSAELNEAASDAELVILVGMGRAIESNLSAAFTTDAVKLALLKDANVAGRVGGALFDCVCKYEPVG